MLVPAVALTEFPQGSPGLRAAFVVLSLLVASLFPLAVYRSGIRAQLDRSRARGQALVAAGAVTAWLALTLGAAASGRLRFSPPPPTMVVIFIAVLASAIGIARSPLGRRLATQIPLALLVGYQGFRVAVELLLHRAYVEGLMPVQMSYTGRNFDIISGLTAILVAIWITSGGRSPRVIFAWNTLGLALLVNVVTIAILSAPLPFRVFMNEPSNIWVTHAPWVWLPAVLVLAALMGHVLVYRRLWIESRAAGSASQPVPLQGVPA